MADKPGYAQVKRPLDVALVVLSLPVVIPVICLVILAIKVSGPANPVWFAERRTGQDGRDFRMLKFATMVRNAKAMEAQLQHLNVLPPPDFKIPNDPRITSVGRFLRQTSLDELPQLLNVLVGDMSLIGPRPTNFGPSSWDAWHTERVDVRPGMTGLWQVRGRGRVSFDERVRMDIAYVRGMSLRMDVGILLSTVGAVIGREGM